MQRARTLPRFARSADAPRVVVHAVRMHQLPFLLGNQGNAAVIHSGARRVIDCEHHGEQSLAGTAAVAIAGTAVRTG